VEARIILDLKVGAAFTRLQTLTLQNQVQQIAEGTSIVSYGTYFEIVFIRPLINAYLPGPCQFPTLGFVVQRYAYVKVFRPESFWYIYLSLIRQSTSQGEEETKFSWKRHHWFDRVEVTEIFSMMMESRLARVTKVNSKVAKKWYEVNS
jgi:DNA topoisomerase-3